MSLLKKVTLKGTKMEDQKKHKQADMNNNCILDLSIIFVIDFSQNECQHSYNNNDRDSNTRVRKF